ncbi:MAG: hypothetical protein ACREQH_11385 [Candidatus Binatus sp.]
MGVLQGLWRRGVLGKFDYLSTVSGGGFIGGWWSAWLSRSARTEIFPAPEQIEPDREPYIREKSAAQYTDSSISAGVDPIHHLRLFSNYLTPRKGALSLDTWRAITVGFRNLLLTWLILLPVMVAVIILAQLYFVHFQRGFFHTVDGSEYLGRLHLLLAPLVFLGGLFVMTSFAWIVNTWDNGSKGTWYVRLISVVFGFVAGALFAGAIAYEALDADLSAMWKQGLNNPFTSQLGAWPVLEWLVAAITILIWCYFPRKFRMLTPDELSTHLTQTTQAILVVLVTLGAVLGFFGFVQEFWACVASEGHGYVAKSGGWLAVLGSLASIAFALWKASPIGGGDLHADGKGGLGMRIAFAVAPPAALVIIGVLAAEAVDRSFEYLVSNQASIELPALFWSAVVFVSLSLCCSFLETWRHPKMQDLLHWILGFGYVVLLIGLGYAWWNGFTTEPAKQPTEHFVFVGMAVMLGWVGTLGWYVDPNALSLHNFYKARLTRAYLGASNPARRIATSEITDAVSGDDVALSSLQNCQYGGPYHLINTTLNLVGGHDLGTAQRLAAPFLLSKLYCGTVAGYRPTNCYMADRLTLGTAVAVSGAAVSPNMGSMTFGSAVAMLMTFFNIRLGYWAPTPNQANWQSPQARHWPWYTLREFMSQTTDQGKYCNLSDGGHFDNTGVYSLIQRACKNIVMVDCGADPRPSFQDLGNLIRRCRIDFGTEIDINISNLATPGSPVTRCLVGTIEYSEEHLRSLGSSRQDRSGTLMLIKPSLTEVEAAGGAKGNPLATADIRQFRLTNPDYPQISTADQWFGEAQFESYRQLGELSAETFASDPHIAPFLNAR